MNSPYWDRYQFNKLAAPLWVIAISTALMAAILLLSVLYAVSKYLEFRYQLGESIRCAQNLWAC